MGSPGGCESGNERERPDMGGVEGTQNLVQGGCRAAVDTRPAAHANVFREYVDQCEVNRGDPQLYSRKYLHLIFKHRKAGMQTDCQF